MTIHEAARILDAQIVCGEEKAHIEVESACGSDLMSDVLAFAKEHVILLTGLINVQVIRTAEMMDITAVCFVRGKKPSQDMINLAKESGIILLTTSSPMFASCGKLYTAGLK